MHVMCKLDRTRRGSLTEQTSQLSTASSVTARNKRSSCWKRCNSTWYESDVVERRLMRMSQRQ